MTNETARTKINILPNVLYRVLVIMQSGYT